MFGIDVTKLHMCTQHISCGTMSHHFGNPVSYANAKCFHKQFVRNMHSYIQRVAYASSLRNTSTMQLSLETWWHYVSNLTNTATLPFWLQTQSTSTLLNSGKMRFCQVSANNTAMPQTYSFLCSMPQRTHKGVERMRTLGTRLVTAVILKGYNYCEFAPYS